MPMPTRLVLTASALRAAPHGPPRHTGRVQDRGASAVTSTAVSANRRPGLSSSPGRDWRAFLFVAFEAAILPRGVDFGVMFFVRRTIAGNASGRFGHGYTPMDEAAVTLIQPAGQDGKHDLKSRRIDHRRVYNTMRNTAAQGCVGPVVGHYGIARQISVQSNPST